MYLQHAEACIDWRRQVVDSEAIHFAGDNTTVDAAVVGGVNKQVMRNVDAVRHTRHVVVHKQTQRHLKVTVKVTVDISVLVMSKRVRRAGH